MDISSKGGFYTIFFVRYFGRKSILMEVCISITLHRYLVKNSVIKRKGSNRFRTFFFNFFNSRFRSLFQMTQYHTSFSFVFYFHEIDEHNIFFVTTTTYSRTYAYRYNRKGSSDFFRVRGACLSFLGVVL